MDKGVILFGAGTMSEKVYRRLEKQVKAVIDNDTSKVGNMIWDNVPIISLECYKENIRIYL